MVVVPVLLYRKGLLSRALSLVLEKHLNNREEHAQ
jgi:hypothetical protein